MKLSSLLCEELYLNEADIRALPSHLRGLKAYELAYNKALSLGVLHGAAMPLNFNVLAKSVMDPKLTRSKNSFELHTGDYQRGSGAIPDENFKLGDTHDFIHLLTSTMIRQAADKVDPRNNVYKAKSAKMNNKTPLPNKVIYKWFKDYELTTFIDAPKMVKKYTGEDLIAKIQGTASEEYAGSKNVASSVGLQEIVYDMKEALRKMVDSLGVNMSGIELTYTDAAYQTVKEFIKDNKITKEQGLELSKLINVTNFLQQVLDRSSESKEHYRRGTESSDHETLNYLGNMGEPRGKNKPNSPNLPQYDTEEDQGNSVMFNLNKDAGLGIGLSPFADAIRFGVLIPPKDQEKVLAGISLDSGRRQFRPFDRKEGTKAVYTPTGYQSTPIVQPRLDKLGQLLSEVLPVIFKWYNYYIKLILKMPWPSAPAAKPPTT